MIWLYPALELKTLNFRTTKLSTLCSQTRRVNRAAQVPPRLEEDFSCLSGFWNIAQCRELLVFRMYMIIRSNISDLFVCKPPAIQCKMDGTLSHPAI